MYWMIHAEDYHHCVIAALYKKQEEISENVSIPEWKLMQYFHSIFVMGKIKDVILA